MCIHIHTAANSQKPSVTASSHLIERKYLDLPPPPPPPPPPPGYGQGRERSEVNQIRTPIDQRLPLETKLALTTHCAVDTMHLPNEETLASRPSAMMTSLNFATSSFSSRINWKRERYAPHTARSAAMVRWVVRLITYTPHHTAS